MDNITAVTEMESALIGAVLRDGSIYIQVRDIIKPETFGVHAFGKAWLAMEHLFESHSTIDVFTIADELERMGAMSDFSHGRLQGRALLSELRASGEPKNILSYAENVQDYALKRELDLFWPKCAMWSKNGRRAEVIIKDVYSELGKMAPYQQQDEFTVPFSKAISEGYDETDRASRGENVGVKTGLVDVDRIFGSLLPDNVYLVAGRPGDGKTGLLLTIAKHTAEKSKRVAIFSLEMSRAQIGQRILSQESGIDLDKIIQGKMKADEWPLFTMAVEQCEKLPIIVNDLSGIDISNIRNTARKIHADGGLDLIIVDYIQLANADEKKQNRELEVSAVSRGLKELARELHVPILAASQLSREIEKRTSKRPVLSDLRESGSLEQDAYAVMFIYKPDEKQPALRELLIEKHRNGKTGSVPLRWIGQNTKFESATVKEYDFKN